MSWSYSGNPAGSVLDAVRFEIPDTNSTSPLLQDEEIEYAISQEAPGSTPSEGEVLSAAARCLETISRLLAMQADTQLGSLSETYSKTAQNHAKRAKELRNRAAGMHAPWAGGRSLAEKQARSEDTDTVQPEFRRGQFDSPYTGRSAGIFRSGDEGSR